MPLLWLDMQTANHVPQTALFASWFTCQCSTLYSWDYTNGSRRTERYFLALPQLGQVYGFSAKDVFDGRQFDHRGNWRMSGKSRYAVSDQSNRDSVDWACMCLGKRSTTTRVALAFRVRIMLADGVRVYRVLAYRIWDKSRRQV